MLADVLELAGAKDVGMAGGDLLDQAGARARHAEDEDRQLGPVAPAGGRGEKRRGEPSIASSIWRRSASASKRSPVQAAQKSR